MSGNESGHNTNGGWAYESKQGAGASGLAPALGVMFLGAGNVAGAWLVFGGGSKHEKDNKRQDHRDNRSDPDRGASKL